MKRIQFNRETEKNVYDNSFYSTHMQYYKRALPFISQFLRELNMNSFCDIGCGNGDMLSTIQNEFNTLGIDFSVGSIELQKLTNFICHDLTLPLKLNRTFDVVISLETYEHIPKEYEQQFLDNIFTLAPKILILSCAEPKQWGRRHYNPIGKDTMINKILSYEYNVDTELTEKFYKIKYLATFYRKNTVIFRKNE